jgi:hypothetical protein
LCLGAALAAVTLAAAQARAQSPYQTSTCPLPADVQGYPVTVRADGSTAVDSAFARALADAVARRWEVPSQRRSGFGNLGSVHGRIVPPEPRWADDWSPGAEHTARMAVTFYRDGRAAAARVVRGSGDRLFDRSLATIFGRSPYDHPLPAFPAGAAADSVQLLVGLGETPDAGTLAVKRFAAQQSPVRVVEGTLRINAQRAAWGTGASGVRFAIVKYNVNEQGRLVGEVETIRSSDREMSLAVGNGLAQARFEPARSNCRVIAQSVVQNFSN